MALKGFAVLCLVLVLVLYVEVCNSVVRTWYKDKMLYNQYRTWCSKKHVHRCKYTRQDYEYFHSLCNETQTHGFSPKSVTGSRKEYRCMSTSERNGYHESLRGMKSTMAGAQNQYDSLVVLHDSRRSPTAHFSPGFCPWHRIYLFVWERAIKRRCGSCFIPYWDTRLDNMLGGNPQDSVIFSPALAGNADGEVTTGFAANWGITGQCASNGRFLRRIFDTTTNSLYNDYDANAGHRTSSFRLMSFPWSDSFEFTHGYVHTAFGASSQMADILCSPFDPMFLSHHSFVEKMCEDARGRLANQSKYPNVENVNFNDFGGNVAAAHGDNIVRPFNNGHLSMTHKDALLRPELDPIWYNYERSPADVRCRQDADCCANGNTDFIWCNNRRCVSKAQDGATISRAFPNNACYCETGTPVNENGRCACNQR